MPRYSRFWNVGVVLTFLKELGHNSSLSLKWLLLSLKWLSIKTAMLMALTRPSRSTDLAKLNLNTHSYTGKGVSFQPVHLSKQSHPSKPITEFFLLITCLFSLGAQCDPCRHTRGAQNPSGKRIQVLLILILDRET